MKALVLICSIAILGEDCSEATALDVIRTDPGKTAAMCSLFAQAAIATTAIRPDAGKTYEKIVCTKVHEATR